MKGTPSKVLVTKVPNHGILVIPIVKERKKRLGRVDGVGVHMGMGGWRVWEFTKKTGEDGAFLEFTWDSCFFPHWGEAKSLQLTSQRRKVKSLKFTNEFSLFTSGGMGAQEKAHGCVWYSTASPLRSSIECTGTSSIPRKLLMMTCRKDIAKI